ncbi:hypothetical protein [Corallococcus terminator]|uniref:PARP catalytic domain-containing protein n=1 Tax=Corallococcus terminator TaxID=2316733 RepID=A0A3A8JE95_9BACT|nr:hypothetical protein [Corallococcus terminator]RKG94097.1 hypothetical protein D7V88_00630 [Corallococcus terminator]
MPLPHIQDGDIVVPSYWPSRGWAPWPENPAFQVAELPRGSQMFQALERYINGNIQARSFRAKKAERTRMQRAEAILNDTTGRYSSLWRQRAAYRLKEKPDLGGTTPPPESGPVDVSKILIIQNEALWEKYEHKRYQLRSRAGTSLRSMVVEPEPTRSQPGYNTLAPVQWTYSVEHPCPGWRSLPVLDVLRGEVLMFHGTSKDVIPLIAAGGFDPNRCQNRGTVTPDYGLLGKGAYFTDSFSKLMVYTGCNKCGEAECDCVSVKQGLPTNRYSLMCRVVLGSLKRRKPYEDLLSDEIRREDLDSLNGSAFDSVMGVGPDNRVDTQINPTNEFIIKDAAQAYPEFIIYWRRRTLTPTFKPSKL